MRIVVMSDSHRLFSAVQKIMSAQPNADMYIHLGDGEQECKMLLKEYPDKKFFFVKGNCDYDTNLPGSLIIPVAEGNHRIFAAHGHKYSVNFTLTEIIKAAEQNHCDIVLYGHLHERYNGYDNGLHILNPGSCSCPRDGLAPSYAYIDIEGDGIFKNIVSL